MEMNTSGKWPEAGTDMVRREEEEKEGGSGWISEGRLGRQTDKKKKRRTILSLERAGRRENFQLVAWWRHGLCVYSPPTRGGNVIEACLTQMIMAMAME